MRKSPRSGFTAAPGELIALGRRALTGQNWPSASLTNLSLDVVDWDPYNFMGAGNVTPFQGRYLLLAMGRFTIPSTGGASRYMNINVAGSAIGIARAAWTSVEQSVFAAGGFASLNKGQATFLPQFFQDSGVAATIHDVEVAVFYAGAT